MNTSMIGCMRVITPMDSNKYINMKTLLPGKGENHKGTLIRSKDNPDETLNERAPNSTATGTIVHV